MKFLCLSSFSIATLFISFQLQANDWFAQNRLEGFVSQSVIHSSDHNFMSRSDDNASFDMWEAGALFSTNVYEQISFSTQLLGRKISHHSGNNIRLDYAFLGIPVYDATDTQYGLRLGRIRSSYGLYNETRDIPHTRTGVFMPQSIYYDQTRNTSFSTYGAELFMNRQFGEQTLGFQVLFGRPIADDKELEEGSEFNASNLEGDRTIMARLSFGSEFEGWRGAITYFRPEYTIDLLPDLPFDPATLGLPGPVTNVRIYAQNSRIHTENIITSLEYNQLDWSITAEYGRQTFHTNANVDIDRTINNTPFAGLITPAQRDAALTYTKDLFMFRGHEESFYIQGLYRWNEYFESYIRYDASHTRELSYADPAGHIEDINIGASWRPDQNWLVRGELHYVDGWARLFSRDNPNLTRNRYWTMAALQVAYRW